MRFLCTICLLGLATLAPAQDSVIRISEADAKKALVSKTDPAYPEIARKMHLSGRVVVDVFIGEDGKVENAKPVNGNALLTGAAVAAVKNWKFTPFAPDGSPKKAVASFAFDFKL
jgi:TonB family protein